MGAGAGTRTVATQPAKTVTADKTQISVPKAILPGAGFFNETDSSNMWSPFMTIAGQLTQWDAVRNRYYVTFCERPLSRR